VPVSFMKNKKKKGGGPIPFHSLPPPNPSSSTLLILQSAFLSKCHSDLSHQVHFTELTFLPSASPPPPSSFLLSSSIARQENV